MCVIAGSGKLKFMPSLEFTVVACLADIGSLACGADVAISFAAFIAASCSIAGREGAEDTPAAYAPFCLALSVLDRPLSCKGAG